MKVVQTAALDSDGNKVAAIVTEQYCDNEYKGQYLTIFVSDENAKYIQLHGDELKKLHKLLNDNLEVG